MADVLTDNTKTPFSTAWFTERVVEFTGKAKAQVVAARALEETVVRSKHSAVVKAVLDVRDGDGGDPYELPFIVKRIVVSELPARSEEKLTRDIDSYRNEVLFYRDGLAAEMPVRVPRFAFMHSSPPEMARQDMWFLEVIEFLQGYEQVLWIGERDARVCLDYLAKMHAHFWERVDKVEASLHAHGSFWTMDKRDKAEVGTLADNWEKIVAAYGELDPDLFARPEVVAFGANLMARAPGISATLAQRRAQRTLVHGDFKCANLFFKQGRPGRDEYSEMAAIDFQWSGSGIGAQDVAYLLYGSLAADTLADKRDDLVAFYHGRLAAHLGGGEALAAYPLSSLQADIELSLLDYCRVIFTYMWPIPVDKLVANGTVIARTTHNRSTAVAVQLVRDAVAALGRLA